MDVKKIFADSLVSALESMEGGFADEQAASQMSLEEIIERPKDAALGDLAFPCFQLAKLQRKAPQQIAAALASALQDEHFDRVEAVGAYVNVYLNRSLFGGHVLSSVLTMKDSYGNHHFGSGLTVTIDLSAPNIAKPFSMGHLRSTVIGNALAMITEKCGYQVIKINHLGDWGTQFGKLITAYLKWGDEQLVSQQPIRELLALYIRFHEEAERDPSLNDMGRAWFKRLEDGDGEAIRLWKWFREESLKEFSRIYDLLGVDFDSFEGEAFYNDKMDRVVKELEEKNLLVPSEGALVVRLDDQGMPPCLIKKSDGATLYATRDLAAALYRQETYHFAKALYVVGHEQSLHFKQVFEVLSMMGYAWAAEMKHIPFGLILKDGKKMSTRKGKLVLLDEVLQQAIALAEAIISEKNPALSGKKTIAREVGVGAVIFHDLKNDRINDIEFSLEDMLRFDGETGPYVQYTHARACSLLRKGGHDRLQMAVPDDAEAWPIIALLDRFPGVVSQAFDDAKPSAVAKYAVDLAQSFNKYYGNVRVLDDAERKAARLSLVYAVTIVLKESLRVLGIGAPEEM